MKRKAQDYFDFESKRKVNLLREVSVGKDPTPLMVEELKRRLAEGETFRESPPTQDCRAEMLFEAGVRHDKYPLTYECMMMSALRAGNAKLLDKLVTCWPADADPFEVVSQACWFDHDLMETIARLPIHLITNISWLMIEVESKFETKKRWRRLLHVLPKMTNAAVREGVLQMEDVLEIEDSDVLECLFSKGVTLNNIFYQCDEGEELFDVTSDRWDDCNETFVRVLLSLGMVQHEAFADCLNSRHRPLLLQHLRERPDAVEFHLHALANDPQALSEFLPMCIPPYDSRVLANAMEKRASLDLLLAAGVKPADFSKDCLRHALDHCDFLDDLPELGFRDWSDTAQHAALGWQVEPLEFLKRQGVSASEIKEVRHLCATKAAFLLEWGVDPAVFSRDLWRDAVAARDGDLVDWLHAQFGAGQTLEEFIESNKW